MKRVYLDNAAATPVDERVITQMNPFFAEQFYNPSALYREARDAKASLEAARSEVAQLIGAKPAEILFTAGGTESDNLALQGVLQRYPDKQIVISAIEHDAVYEPAQLFSNCIELPVDERGIVRLELLNECVSDDVVLVSVMLVNNEIGTVQPIQKIVEITETIRRERTKRGVKTPLFVHTDACQAPLYLDIQVKKLGVDFMTLNGGKIHGPKQSGILYVRTGVDIAPLIRGGGQEFGKRSGTEHLAAAVGFAMALKLAGNNKQHRVKSVSELRDYFIVQLEQRFHAEINGHRKHRIANNINALFRKTDNERVLFALDELGVAAAAGSACSASKEPASRVLRALGRTETEARSSIRFSLSQYTTREELDFTLDQLEKALQA